MHSGHNRKQLQRDWTHLKYIVHRQATDNTLETEQKQEPRELSGMVSKTVCGPPYFNRSKTSFPPSQAQSPLLSELKCSRDHLSDLLTVEQWTQLQLAEDVFNRSDRGKPCEGNWGKRRKWRQRSTNSRR